MARSRTALWLRLGLALAAFTVALPFFLVSRGYPWNLGLVMSLAVAALVYVGVMTIERLAGLYRS